MIPAASVLDRSQACLAVIDVQERLAAVMPHRERVVARTKLLIRAAVITGIPVVVTRQYPQGLGPIEGALIAAIEAARAADHDVVLVDKMTFDCFAEPAFVDAICASGRRQLVLAGMETHICVTQTALSGLGEGFDVHVVADASCSREDESHLLALARLGTAGAVVTTAESAAYELVGRAGTDEFKALLTAVKAMP